MSPFIRLLRNSLWILLARVGAQACMVVVTYLLAHHLGTAGFGEYSFMAAIVVIGNVVTTFGTDMVLIRDIAAKDDFSKLLAVLILQLLLSCVFIAFIYMFSTYLPNQTAESILALKIYSLALLPLAFFTVFTSMLRGKQKMDTYAGLNFVIPFLLVIAIIIFARYKSNIVMLAYVLLGVQIVGAILAGMLCALLFPRPLISLKFLPKKLISLVSLCLPIALIAIMGIMYQKLSLTMLSLLGSAAAVGLFSAASRILDAARMVHVAAYTALYPAMAEGSSGIESHGEIRHSISLLFGVAALALVSMFVFAKSIINILFGLEYQASIPLLKILSFTMIPYTANSYFSLMFLAKGREKIVLGVLTLSFLLLLILNLLLIPSVGLSGAGWAMLMTEITQTALFLFENKLHPADSYQSLITEKGISHELPNSS